MVPVEEREELEVLLAEGPNDGVLILDNRLHVQENAVALHILLWGEVGGILSSSNID